MFEIEDNFIDISKSNTNIEMNFKLHVWKVKIVKEYKNFSNYLKNAPAKSTLFLELHSISSEGKFKHLICFYA